MAIDFVKGFKRIYIVLASFYLLAMTFMGYLTIDNVKDYKELLIGNVSCEKLQDVIRNRNEIEKQENNDVNTLELLRFDLFLKTNKLENENFPLIDKTDGCYGRVDLNIGFFDKYTGFLFVVGILGLLPVFTIYYLLVFIINGFRKEK